MKHICLLFIGIVVFYLQNVVIINIGKLKLTIHVQKSKKILKMWFSVIWLFTYSKQGVNVKDLERQLGVSYPTAWLWLQKL